MSRLCLTFPVPVRKSGDQQFGGDMVVIQEGINVPTVSYRGGGGVIPRWKLPVPMECMAIGFNSHEQCVMGCGSGCNTLRLL